MTNIFKYQEFINEGIIFYDPTFLEVLEKIKDNPSIDSSSRKIANKLFFIEGEEIIKMDIGAVGFSDNPKTLKFKSFKKLKDELGKGGIEGAVQSTYSPVGSGSRNTIKDILSKSKDEIKIGRIVKKILTYIDEEDSFSDSDIEKFVNTLKTEFKKKDDAFDNFELVSGDDINKYYLADNYVKSNGILRGTLGSSCMRHRNTNKYMNFYNVNSDDGDVKLLIYKNPQGDGILGRALVWKAFDNDVNDEVIFMDRVYSVNDSDVNLFREYANKNGWIYKDENNSSENFSFKGDSKDIEVYVKKGKYENYPYLDTLVYYDFVNGVLSNYSGNFKHGNFINLESTNGEYYCDECDGDGDMECEGCYGSGEMNCEECNGDGDIYCDECFGEGEMDCEECGGEGEIDCPKCDGEGCGYCFDSGSIDCEKCEGYGYNDCSVCGGDGSNRCEECGGEGEIECDVCGGEGETSCSEESCINHLHNTRPFKYYVSKDTDN